MEFLSARYHQHFMPKKVGNIASFRCKNQVKGCSGKIKFKAFKLNGKMKANFKAFKGFSEHLNHCEYFDTNIKLRRLSKFKENQQMNLKKDESIVQNRKSIGEKSTPPINKTDRPISKNDKSIDKSPARSLDDSVYKQINADEINKSIKQINKCIEQINKDRLNRIHNGIIDKIVIKMGKDCKIINKNQDDERDNDGFDKMFNCFRSNLQSLVRYSNDPKYRSILNENIQIIQNDIDSFIKNLTVNRPASDESTEPKSAYADVQNDKDQNHQDNIPNHQDKISNHQDNISNHQDNIQNHQDNIQNHQDNQQDYEHPNEANKRRQFSRLRNSSNLFNSSITFY